MNIGNIKRIAKESLKGNWGVAIGVVVVAALITSIASATFGIVQLVIAGPLSVGLCGIFAGIVRKRKVEFDNMFNGFHHFFTNFVTGLLVNVFTFLWGLLFVIPGIIKRYSYAMTFFIQNDHPEMTETDAITASRMMMRGHKMQLFLLDLSFIGWYLLATITFGILLLYVIPYHNAARAAFYDELSLAQAPASEDEHPKAQATDEAVDAELAKAQAEAEAEQSSSPKLIESNGDLHGTIVYDENDPFANPDGGETIDGGD